MSAFTKAQTQAIHQTGNVIVVAGAGAGKTRTLVERCLQRVVAEGKDGKKCSLENILMVTFTEAAAAEMRERIRVGLLKRLDAASDTAHVQEQLALLDTAHISTLHAFCLRLLREHFHEINELDPQFTVLDEKQVHVLIQEALEFVLGVHYEGKSSEHEAVRGLIRRMGRGSDERIRERILKIHRYTQTLPDPGAWFREQHELHGEADPVRWRRWFVEFFVGWRKEFLQALKGAPAEVPCVQLCMTALTSVGAAPTFEAAAAAGARVAFLDEEKDGEKPNKNWPRGTKGSVRDPLENYFKEAAFLAALCDPSGKTDPLLEDWRIAQAQAASLLGLVEMFGCEFAKLKRASAGVDFADLEQFSIQLLRRPEIAARWRAQFEHVFVDEYQDINAAQDAILCAVSGEGTAANRFLVGDVKQSIYRFRLADPHIFREYEQTWRKNPAAGQSISLSENFRSREAILNIINPFFRELMRPEVGGVEYGTDVQLQFGARDTRNNLSANAPESVGPRVEFFLIDKNDSQKETEEDGAEPESSGISDEQDVSKAAAEFLDIDLAGKEARIIAQRLRCLEAEKHKVWDDEKKTFRRVEWKDMVVLLRACAAKAEVYAKEFNRAGVPLHARRSGFYGALEVMDLLNLQRLLDNPQQDFPLLAVLRSPLVGLSVDELAAIRAHNVKARSFWGALQSFLAAAAPVEDPAATAWAKATGFLAAHTRWRNALRMSSLTVCLETILDETRYEALLQIEARGLERVANVRRLLDLARQFDPLQRQGLHRFLRFVEIQQEAEREPEPASPQSENAVRLMTIHQSKGLEYPVVVLADMGKKFNLSDLRDDLLMDKEYGLCQHLYPTTAARHYPSLPHWLAAQREKAEQLGEELRLLYVAMTRARDTLILTGAAGKKDSSNTWREASDEPVPAEPIKTQAILNASSAMDWLLAWLPRVTRKEEWAANQSAGENPLLRWEIYARDDQRLHNADTQSPTSEPVAETTENAIALPPLLIQKLQWQYVHETATTEPAKASVTALRRRAEADDDEAVQKFRVSSFSLPKSRDGAMRSKLSAAEIGTAHHTFQQFVALDCTGSVAALDAEAERLRAAGVLTMTERAALKLPALAQFWDSVVGRQIRAEAKAVRRELQFTARFSPVELTALGLMKEEMGADEFVVVQGVADLVVMLPEEIWLLDFKTDSVTAGVEEKRAHYAPQLKLYASALEKIYNRRVTHRWLHFFDVGETTSV